MKYPLLLLRRVIAVAAMTATITTPLTLIACANASAALTAKPTIEQMQKRASERSATRWKALIDKRFDEAYDFLSDASKVGVTASDYAAAMQKMGFIASSLDTVSCDESVCAVKSSVTLPVFIRNVGSRPQTVPVEEQWILQNGELWLIRR